jgi:abhydrolase domain-containing protein 17
MHIVNRAATLTMLMSHGNGEDLFQNAEVLHNLAGQLGISVLMYEYYGYSLAEGEPSEQGLYQCIDAAYAHLTQVLKIAPANVILHGRSLGSAPTVDLCSRWRHDPPAGMILISPVASGARIVLGRAAMLGYPVDMFMNDSKIERVPCPTLVIHGTKDTVVPVEHGQLLYSLLSNPYPPLWLEGAGHNDIEFHYGRELMATMREFMVHVKLRPGSTAGDTGGDRFVASVATSPQQPQGCLPDGMVQEHRNCY